MNEVPLLRLLLDDAPVGAFEEFRSAAERAGRDRVDVERRREAVLLALQVRDVLAERRRREQELSALNETASDLTATRDIDAVLRAIVRRGRQLLDSDACYLTLIDEDRGDTYMRVTDGIVARDFKELRLEFGKGLGGLVAQSASAYATSNYLEDPQFDHTEPINVAVAREHLVAIAGVPLLLGDRVIGVLFAADRHERTFDQQALRLLGALAAHAAVAINNARLFTEATEAVARLNDANAVIRAHSAAVERAAAAHERLTDLVLHGGDVADVARSLAHLLGGALIVVGPDDRLLAAVGGHDEQVPGWLRDPLTEVRASGRTVRASGDGVSRWVTPVVAGNRHLAAFALSLPADPDDADLRTLERAAQVTALLLMNQRAVSEAEQRVRGELVEDLLAAGTRDEAGLLRRGLLLGADLEQAHVAVVLRADGAGQRGLTAAVAVARDARGLAARRRGDLVLLMPGDDPAGSARAVAARLRSALGCAPTVGAAGPASGPVAIAAAVEEASRCVRLLLALDRRGTVATTDQLGAYGLLLHNSEPGDAAAFVDRELGPVLRWDARHGTELVTTLAAYFDSDGNLRRAAAALHVHVNTLYQRLDRVGALLGRRWRDPEAALHVHLALRLHRLAAPDNG
jgi:DNA-binding PucR family transcriptional regulator